MHDKQHEDGSLPRLLTVAEVAARLGIAPKTLRNKLARRDGSAPTPIKSANGYNIRFAKADVEAWIADHRDTNNTNEQE